MSRPMLCSSTGKKVFFKIDTVKKKCKSKGSSWRWYRCKDCSFYHLSHKGHKP